MAFARLRRFRLFLLGFACAVVSFIFFAFGVGFGRLAVAVVLCACLAVPVCHTATALFKFTLF